MALALNLYHQSGHQFSIVTCTGRAREDLYQGCSQLPRRTPPKLLEDRQPSSSHTVLWESSMLEPPPLALHQFLYLWKDPGFGFQSSKLPWEEARWRRWEGGCHCLTTIPSVSSGCFPISLRDTLFQSLITIQRKCVTVRVMHKNHPVIFLKLVLTIQFHSRRKGFNIINPEM